MPVHTDTPWVFHNSTLWGQPVWSPVQVGDFTNVGTFKKHHQEPCQADAAPSVRRAAVSEEVEVMIQGFETESLARGLLYQLVDTMLTLCTRGDLEPLPEKVEAQSQFRVVSVAHVVESTHFSRVVGHENKLVAILLGNVRAQHSLAFRVQVFLVGNLVTLFVEDLAGLLEGDARERQRRNDNLYAEDLFDLSTVRFVDYRNDIAQPLLFEMHDVFIRVDPCQLHVDRGELGVVARRERRVRTKDRCDLEDPVEPAGDPHLLVELRGLRQVGRLVVEVRKREELGARFAGCTDQLGRVDLDEPLAFPEFAHGALHGRLYSHDQLVPRPAKAEVPMVNLDVEGRIGLYGKRSLGKVRDREGLELKLDTPQFHLAVGDDRSSDGDSRLGSERTHQLGSLVVFRRLLVHDLDCSGAVVKHHELDLLLVTNGTHKSLDGDLFADVTDGTFDK
ncbi:MAG: hypothetical protein JWM52_173 [Candidatus Saccharibacteria bacterium]|nr:hypothetical protein [Candidatus Saccharibacteria bacterium]